MHAIILLITVFYFGSTDKAPEAGVLVAESPAACLAAGPVIKAKLEANSAVKVVLWSCMDADGSKDKS